MTIQRGDLIHNVKTGDYAIALNSPVIFSHLNQAIVNVLIAGAPTTTLWHAPDVVTADTPYRALSVGDVVSIDKGRKTVWAVVTYVWRLGIAINVEYKGKEYLYKGAVHSAIPAALARAMKGA